MASPFLQEFMKINKSLRLHELSQVEREKVLAMVYERKIEAFDWIEKIRRFVSFYGKNLKKICKGRLGKDFQPFIIWMHKVLIQSYMEADYFDISRGALFNALLYSNDALPFHSSSFDIIHKDFLSSTRDVLKPSENIILDQNIKFLLEQKYSTFSKKNGFWIFCPNPYSQYTSMVILILERLGVKIEGIVLRKFSINRFLEEYQRDGVRLIRKIWRQLIIKTNENSQDENIFTYEDLMSRFNYKIKNIKNIAKKKKIKVISVKDFSSNNKKFLREKNLKIGIFTGGGKISQSIIDLFEFGIVNAHLGILPKYRGMDVVQAAILDGEYNKMGVSSHLMIDKIDQGPILTKVNVSGEIFPDIESWRNAIGPLMPFLIVLSALAVRFNIIQPENQTEGDGFQFYKVHKALQVEVNNIMKYNFKNKDNSLKDLIEEFCSKLEID